MNATTTIAGTTLILSYIISKAYLLFHFELCFAFQLLFVFCKCYGMCTFLSHTTFHSLMRYTSYEILTTISSKVSPYSYQFHSLNPYWIRHQRVDGPLFCRDDKTVGSTHPMSIHHVVHYSESSHSTFHLLCFLSDKYWLKHQRVDGLAINYSNYFFLGQTCTRMVVVDTDTSIHVRQDVQLD